MKSPYYSNAMQSSLFTGVTIPIVQPTLWLALHSKDPTRQDSQALYEIAGLPRAAVARGIRNWLVTGTYWANVLPIDFMVAQGNGVAKYWTLGLAQSGAGIWLISGKMADAVTIAPGTMVSIPAGALTSEEI